VRRKVRGVGVFEYAALVAALGSAGALLGWGLQAAHSASGLLEGSPPAPYFVFAGFGGFAALLDLKVILQGGIDGVARIRRHLWRMCFALFFVTSFFFLGQQQVMPAFMRGSPVLFVPALAPLVVMIFWLIRIRFPRWFRKNLSVP